MTKVEAAELGELNLTPEQLKERQRKLNAMLNKVAEGIPIGRDPQLTVGEIAGPTKRRPRSDKGTARPAKPKMVEFAALGITADQASELQAQIKLTFYRREALAVAQMALRDEEIALDSLVKSFVAAGK